MLHHGLAVDVGQRLARQPGGGVTGRNDDDETHGFSSSSGRWRARFSSSTGILFQRIGQSVEAADELLGTGVSLIVQLTLADRAGDDVEQFNIQCQTKLL